MARKVRVKKNHSRKKHRTSWNGWRIVAGGLFLVIFGFSFVTNSFGPFWLGLGMILVGIGLGIYGRKH